MLGSLKLDPFQVKNAILGVNLEKLSDVLLENLLSYIPTDDEVRIFISFFFFFFPLFFFFFFFPFFFLSLFSNRVNYQIQINSER